MYTRRKVFSTMNVDGEEKLFSVCDTILEDQREYAQKEKEEDEDKNKKKDKKVLDKALAGTAGVAAVATGAGAIKNRIAQAEEAMKVAQWDNLTDKIKNYLKETGGVHNVKDPDYYKWLQGEAEIGEREYRALAKTAKKSKKLVKTAAPIAVGAGLAYGGVKLARHLKNKKKKDKE